MSGVLDALIGEEATSQHVRLTGREIPHTLHGYNVSVHPSVKSELDSGAAGSSKVKINTITNQNWELPRGGGTIVASNSQFLAYVLEGKSGYVVRLIQPETSNRSLLKGFVGAVLDVSFAHSDSGLLGCVDEGGNVYLWNMSRVEEVAKAPTDALCVVVQRGHESDKLPHRLVWSPHVGGDDEEECLVVSHGQEVEIIDFHAVMKTVPFGTKISRKSLSSGITTIPGIHSQNVCDLSLSPDGQVLATCGEDGFLKFWSILEQRCLHELNPHEGRPVKRLIFCDNHLSQDPSNQFWRFLLTAADNNTEIKLWCTVTWQCLQTIRFCAPPSGPAPYILVNLDLSASYLVVTDAMRMAVYVLQLNADSEAGSASFTSLTEYLLKQPIFSFIVPGHTPPSHDSVGGTSSSSDSDDETLAAQRQRDLRLSTVGLKLHTIHSRSMQELEIRFEPPDVSGVPPPDHTPLDVKHPSSLPSLASSSHDDSTMASFHSLTETGSPKLLTPSQFLTPNKSDVLLPSPKDFEAISPHQSSLTSVTTESLSPNVELLSTLSSDPVEPTADHEKEEKEVATKEDSVKKELNESSVSEGLSDDTTPAAASHFQVEATSTSTPTEFVSLPKTQPETVSNSVIVTAAAMGTPSENLDSFKRSNSNEGDSPTQQEEAWHDLGGPDLSKTIVSNDQNLSGVLDYPVSADGSGVYDSPVVRSGGGGFVGEESRLVSDVMPPAIDDVPPVAGKGGGVIQVSADELITLRVREETPVISDEPAPPAQVDSVINEDASSHELIMPSAEPSLEVFNLPPNSAEESHDQSHDLLSDVSKAVSSDKQAALDQDHSELRETSQSDGEVSRSVPAVAGSGDLLALVARQQEEIIRLSKEQGERTQRLEQRLAEMQSALLQAQSNALQEQSKKQDGRLERVLREKQASEKARHDKLTSSLTSALTGAVKNKLDHLVKTEMKNLVLPALQRSMGAVQSELSAMVSQRVTATDSVVREGISRILQTQGLSESVGNAVAASLQRTMAARYEEVFKSTVLPGFEKGCQEMFRQIDEAFRRGTTEYLGQLSQHNRQMAEITHQQVTQSLNSLVGGGQGSPLSTHIQSSMRQEMSVLLQNIQRMVTESVTANVTKEIQSAFEEHYKQSPAAKEEEERKRKEEEIVRLVGEHQYNSAFEVALSTSDLKLVMLLCSKVNPDMVFDKSPCPLSQPVLLSLIQQLSVDLEDQLELKIKYLEHSLLALDVGNDVTRSHMTPVVSQLSQKLGQLDQTKLVKRLNMMARHLVGQ